MFESIKIHWREARGSQLRRELEDAMRRLSTLDKQVALIASLSMVEGVKSLEQNIGPMANISVDGKTKLAKTLQKQARNCFDFDMGKAYGLALLSMLIESSVLPGKDAEYSFEVLFGMLSDAVQIYNDING